MTFKQTFQNAKSCSPKCAGKNPEKINKIKQTCIEKYGVDNPNKTEQVREKYKSTCLKKYGTSSSLSKNSFLREKINQYWKDRGVDNPGQVQEIKEKIKKTNFEKYGNENYLKSDDFHRKSRETCLKHFGVDHQFKNKKIKEKIKQSIREKFGVENTLQLETSKEAQRKVKNSQSFKTLERYKDYVVPMFNESEWEGPVKNKVYRWKCVRCGNEFEQKIYSTHFNKEENMPRCLNCFPKINGFSYMELELLEFCQKFFPSASKNKQLIKPYELDICIPEIKLAIEFNGIFYHCLENSGTGYHLNKIKLCNEKGYRLIHIWEDEWLANKENIKQKLEEILIGKENLNFSEKEIILDRSWYNNIDIPGYLIKEEIPPEIVKRNKFDVENCGWLKYEQI